MDAWYSLILIIFVAEMVGLITSWKFTLTRNDSGTNHKRWYEMLVIALVPHYAVLLHG